MLLDVSLDGFNSAVLSPCRQYRYLLGRQVSMLGSSTFAYFGINPSTADEQIDDQTVKKWIGFTKRNDGRQFLVGNVFAYRATDVNQIKKASDPVGESNQQYIEAVIASSDILVPCWGRRTKIPAELRGYLDSFMEMLLHSGKPVMCFGKTKSGDPMHPQMLGYDTSLELWDVQQGKGL